MDLVSEYQCSGPIAKVALHNSRPLLLAVISGTWEIVVLSWEPDCSLGLCQAFNRHDTVATYATLDFCAVDAVFHPLQPMIAVTANNVVGLWSLEKQEMVRYLSPFYQAHSISLFPDGRKVLAGSWVPPQQVHKPHYSAKLATVVMDLETGAPLEYFFYTHNCSFSTHGHFAIALQGEQCATNIRVLGNDSDHLTLFKKRIVRDDSLIDAVVSHTATSFATLGNAYELTLEVWDFPSLERVGIMRWPLHYMPCATPYYLSRQVRYIDGHSLVMVTPDEQIIEIDVPSMAIREGHNARTGRAGTLDYRPDCGLIVTGSEDGTIRMWTHRRRMVQADSEHEMARLVAFRDSYPSVSSTRIL